MGERMTEEQLLQKIYQAVANTGVTYKQIDCDLDEQGDMTIFFSGLEKVERVRRARSMSERMTLTSEDLGKGVSNAITEAVHEILVDRGITEPWFGWSVEVDVDYEETTDD